MGLTMERRSSFLSRRPLLKYAPSQKTNFCFFFFKKKLGTKRRKQSTRLESCYCSSEEQLQARFSGPAGYKRVPLSSDCTPEALLPPTAPWGSRHGWSPWQQDLRMGCRKPAQRGCSEACSQQALQGFPAPCHHLRAQDPLSRNPDEGLGKGPLVQSGPLPHSERLYSRPLQLRPQFHSFLFV